MLTFKSFSHRFHFGFRFRFHFGFGFRFRFQLSWFRFHITFSVTIVSSDQIILWLFFHQDFLIRSQIIIDRCTCIDSTKRRIESLYTKRSSLFSLHLILLFSEPSWRDSSRLSWSIQTDSPYIYIDQQNDLTLLSLHHIVDNISVWWFMRTFLRLNLIKLIQLFLEQL